MTLIGRHEIAGHDKMLELGGRIARTLHLGDVVLLHGELGAGKTTLTQGIAAALGVAELVQSPTFGIVADYRCMIDGNNAAHLYHLDLYRLESVDDLETFDYADLIAPVDGVTIVEWPERAEGWLPGRFLLGKLSYLGADRRLVEIRLVDRDVTQT